MNPKEIIIHKDTKGIFLEDTHGLVKNGNSTLEGTLTKYTPLKIPSKSTFKVIGFDICYKRVRMFVSNRDYSNMLEIPYETFLRCCSVETSSNNLNSPIDSILISHTHEDKYSIEALNRGILYMLVIIVSGLVGYLIGG
jgi:hypothetical protein